LKPALVWWGRAAARGRLRPPKPAVVLRARRGPARPVVLPRRPSGSAQLVVAAAESVGGTF